MESIPSETQALRKAFERMRESGSAAEVRAAAVAYYRQRVKEGGTQEAAALELGLRQSTLSKWHRGQARRAQRAAPAAATHEEEKELAALKAEVEGLGPKSPTRRFPVELKKRLVGWAEAKRAAGVTAAEIEEELGIPWASLSKWMASKARGGRPPKLQPVKVVAAAGADSRPILKTPGGFIVEGLDIAGLALLLRHLG